MRVIQMIFDTGKPVAYPPIMIEAFNRRAVFSLLASLTVCSGPLFSHEVVAVGQNPESVTRGFDGNYYITLMGETRVEGDTNGGIVRMEGRKISPFCDGLDDPKGIVMIGEYLVTADFKKVWKVDKNGKKEVLAGPKDFPHPPLYLNDVALAPDGKSVLVTDMGARDMLFDPDKKLWPLDSAEAKAIPMVGRVFRITLDGEVTEAIAPSPDMLCPNGIDQLKDGTIRVAEFFTGSILERKGDGWNVIAKNHRSADGIVHDSKGRFYVSEVMTGKVSRYESDGSGRTEIGTGISSAADILVDEADGVLIVPDTKAGSLVFIEL